MRTMTRVVLSIKLRLCGLGLATVATLAMVPSAQADQEQAWLAFAASGPLQSDSKLRLWFDGHARSQDNFQDLGVSIVRPGIGWQVSPNVTLWAGYARVIARRDGRDDVKEDRIWQQATYPVATVFGGKLSGRTRLEQRDIDGQSDTGHRLRQFWRWSRPIGATSWSWLVANETFINLNNTDFGQDTGYQQNRAFLGFAWQAADKTRLELAYLNNHIDVPTGDNLNNNHNLSLALFHSW